MFMRMKFTIFFLMLFPTASLSLSKRSCKTFKLASPNDSKGYFNMGGATRLSELVNCSAERAKENGDDRGEYKIQSSKIGIILNSTITDTCNMLLDTYLENKKSILQAVREVASPKTMEYVNLEGLVVISYTNSFLVMPKGKRGYWMFAADMNCWPGTLDDCDNDDDLDDTDVVVCGFRLDRKGSSESDTEYRGRVELMEDSDPNSRVEPGVRPWPDYDRAVEMAEEWGKNDVHVEESLATRFYNVFPTLVLSSLGSVFILI